MPTDARTAPHRRGACASALLSLAFLVQAAQAQETPALRLELKGRAEKVFGMADRCQPVDLPDVNPRAYRAADGAVTVFALHFFARRLRGPTLLDLKIDCHVALDSHEDADPAKYDGRRYVTSTWTADGSTRCWR